MEFYELIKYWDQLEKKGKTALLTYFLSTLSLQDIAVVLEERLKTHMKEVLWNSTPQTKYLN